METFLGHSSLATTYRYIYNPLTEEESYKALSEALGDNENNDPEPIDNSEKVLKFTPKSAQKTDNEDLIQAVPLVSPNFR